MSSLGDAEVYSDLLTVQFTVSHGIASLGSILNLLKCHKSKSSRSASLPIQHHCDLGDGSKLTELLLQLPLRGVETQTKHSQTCVGLGRVSVTLVSPPVGHG